jgi:hypothetical protein
MLLGEFYSAHPAAVVLLQQQLTPLPRYQHSTLRVPAQDFSKLLAANVMDLSYDISPRSDRGARRDAYAFFV